MGKLERSGKITACYAKGLVLGEKRPNSIGGLVGHALGTIRACYVQAAVASRRLLGDPRGPMAS